MSLKEKLKEVVVGDVTDELLEREKVSTDWSVFKVLPDVVVAPKNSNDIQKIVQWINEHRNEFPGLALTPRSAGTDMTGGPLNTGIILDMKKYMTGVVSVDQKDLGKQKSAFGHMYQLVGEATVLPGTMYRDFEIKTLEKNMMMPCYPASRDLCTVGGMVANNGAGEKTLKFGQNIDFVKRLKVIFADGKEYVVKPLTFSELQQKIVQRDFEAQLYHEVYALVKKNWELIQSRKPQTTKNASGYYLWRVVQAESIEAFEKGNGFFDLTALIVGAQGTTGIITEITYALVENEPAHDLLVVYIKKLDDVPRLVKTLMRHNLEMLEMYDDNTFKIGVKFFKDFIKDKGIFGSLRYVLRFLPEAWMALVHGIPKLIVLAEFSGKAEEPLHVAMAKAEQEVRALGLSTRKIERDAEEEKFWDFRHDSFKILTEHSSSARTKGKGTRTVPFIDDIAVKAEYLPEYLPRLIKILDEYKLLYTIAGHLGDGNFHVIPLMDIDEIGNGERLFEIADKVYDLALEYHGTLSAEHNDGIVRTPYLQKMFGKEMIDIFAEVKSIFDPQNIFNPGKKVGGTFKTALSVMAPSVNKK